MTKTEIREIISWHYGASVRFCKDGKILYKKPEWPKSMYFGHVDSLATRRQLEELNHAIATR